MKPNQTPEQAAHEPLPPATGSEWTVGKLLGRNALLICAIIEGSKASSVPLTFDFVWYCGITLCLLAARDLSTPNTKLMRGGD